MSPYIRTVTTASGATAVQVVHSERHGKKTMEHIGSAHSEQELAALKSQAQAVIDGDQMTLELGVDTTDIATGTDENPWPITSDKAGYLIDAIDTAYRAVGLEEACDGDEVFKNLVIARLVQPGSKYDSIETLAEIGLASASYRTITRYLPTYATDDFKSQITSALSSHANIGPASLVLYDVTTLYFETDKADDLRKPGFSKERRLEPQITVGLLTDQSGFPLSVGAFEGNMAETRTMLPMIRKLQSSYNIGQVTIVADAGMFSKGNKEEIVAAGLDYILGTRFKEIPYPVYQWRKDNPDAEYKDGQIWQEADRSGRGPDGIPHSVTYYQYSWDRARRTLHGIDEQVAKAQKAIEGKTAIKRNRFVDLKAPNKQINWDLVEKNRALAGIKGYETSNADLTAGQVIDAYRKLFKIEKSFRMSKSDLKARPIYHRKAESIDAHLSVVIAAMAVGHWLESASGLSIKRLVRTLRKFRSFQIQVGGKTVHAASPLPEDVQEIIDRIQESSLPH